MSEVLTHTAPLWRWTGGANGGTWHFVTISGPDAEALSATAAMRKLEGLSRGFGSLKVKARIGESTFATSVFPSKADAGWLLPVKRSVRQAEGLNEGDTLEVTLSY